MKSWHFSLISLLAAGAILSACSKEEAPAVPAETPAVTAPAQAETTEPGGYVPTPEERYTPDAPATAETAPVEAAPAVEAAPETK